jgi:hypothetical protein
MEMQRYTALLLLIFLFFTGLAIGQTAGSEG